MSQDGTLAGRIASLELEISGLRTDRAITQGQFDALVQQRVQFCCRYTAVHSSKVLEVGNASRQNDDWIVQSSWNGGLHQQFYAVPVSDGSGYYKLVNRNSGKAMSLTLWQTEEALNASAQGADELRRRGTSAGAGSITSVERYEVGLTVSARAFS